MTAPGRHAAADGSFGRSAGGAAARGAGLLAVAVILGIVLLQSFKPGVDPYASSVRAGATSPTTAPVQHRGGGTVSSTTTSTTPPRQPADVKVLPANGSGRQGAGSRVQRVLADAHYNVLAATNANGAAVQTSSVYYAAGYQSDAVALAQLLKLGPTAAQPMPTPAPVADTRGANIVVVVGVDLATSTAASAPPTTAASTATTAHRTTVTTAHTTATTAKPAATTTTAHH